LDVHRIPLLGIHGSSSLSQPITKSSSVQSLSTGEQLFAPLEPATNSGDARDEDACQKKDDEMPIIQQAGSHEDEIARQADQVEVLQHNLGTSQSVSADEAQASCHQHALDMNGSNASNQSSFAKEEANHDSQPPSQDTPNADGAIVQLPSGSSPHRSVDVLTTDLYSDSDDDEAMKERKDPPSMNDEAPKERHDTQEISSSLPMEEQPSVAMTPDDITSNERHPSDEIDITRNGMSASSATDATVN
jgi:hypothetical protein